MGKASGLSRREIEVAALLCEGLSQRAIAEQMTVAESTVKTHVKHVYVKPGIHSRQEPMAVIEGYERSGSPG